MQRLANFVVRWPWVVIGLWLAIAVALPLTFPSLNEMAQKHPLAILPSDAPSSVTARKMTEAFHESGTEDLLLVVLTNDKGLGKADEASYRQLVGALREDTRDVVMVQEFVSAPPLRTLASNVVPAETETMALLLMDAAPLNASVPPFTRVFPV